MSNAFRKKLGLAPEPEPEPIALHRPSDDQLKSTLHDAITAHKEGAALRFHAADIAVIVSELLDHRAKEPAAKKPLLD